MSGQLLKGQGKTFEYLNNFATISSYVISVLFEFHSIQTVHLIENSSLNMY